MVEIGFLKTWVAIDVGVAIDFGVEIETGASKTRVGKEQWY